MNETQIFQSEAFGSVRVLEREDGLRKEEAWNKKKSRSWGGGWTRQR